MRILYENKFKTATITRSSERSAYPITNLLYSHLSKWFKFQSADAEWIKIAGSIKASYFSLLNHNLTSSAVITLEGNNTDSWGSPSFSQVLTWSDYLIIESFTEATYNFWRITFSDATNPDGYIRLGGIYIGTFLQMPGMKIDQEIVDNTSTKFDYSASRQLYADLGIDYKDFKINFGFITTAQRDALRVMWSAVGNHTPVIVLIWESDLTLQLPIYCHLKEKITWGRNEGALLPWSTSLSFSEVF